MEGIGLHGLILIVIGCLVIGLGLGVLLGYLLGGGKDKESEQAVKAHAAYRDDVHEHFEQTSQIMSRMVDDYREMYRHMSEGASKLANIHPEKVITPPPAPEAITAQSSGDKPGEDTKAKTGTEASAMPAKADTPANEADRKAPQPGAESKAEDDREKTGTEHGTDGEGVDESSQGSRKESDKERARRLSGEPPLPQRAQKSGGI